MAITEGGMMLIDSRYSISLPAGFVHITSPQFAYLSLKLHEDLHRGQSLSLLYFHVTCRFIAKDDFLCYILDSRRLAFHLNFNRLT